MNASAISNELNSDTTFTIAPRPVEGGSTKNSDKPATPMSEAEFLDRQVADARAAIGNTFRAIGDDLKESVDVRLWAKEHPWMTVGTAAAAGFVAACVFVPTQEDQALKRIAKIEKALGPKPAAPPCSSNGADNQEQYRTGRQSLWTSLAREMIGAVKPVLLSTLTASLTAKASKSDGASEASGASSQPPYPSI